MSLLPPAISDMGTSSGFTYYLQDRAGLGYQALKKAADDLVQQANQRPELNDVYIDGLPDGHPAGHLCRHHSVQAVDLPAEQGHPQPFLEPDIPVLPGPADSK